jgi:hypothetical protein
MGRKEVKMHGSQGRKEEALCTVCWYSLPLGTVLSIANFGGSSPRKEPVFSRVSAHKV